MSQWRPSDSESWELANWACERKKGVSSIATSSRHTQIPPNIHTHTHTQTLPHPSPCARIAASTTCQATYFDTQYSTAPTRPTTASSFSLLSIHLLQINLGTSTQNKHFSSLSVASAPVVKQVQYLHMSTRRANNFQTPVLYIKTRNLGPGQAGGARRSGQRALSCGGCEAVDEPASQTRHFFCHFLCVLKLLVFLLLKSVLDSV
ncbi:hypothetical protein BDP55DRAFT_434897 [Colletotrichum godetiae]|uniref:Uncharacterized protein n=1 Tax=Colletotrichum godetiae TaxID=1209918 RepID=A0AAJ0F181_9PEZI|nr:uncharacterized protein BDP55DRAFT_434897 [Colletotrichum godetiae]KAK1689278.1 hypothetical protein BDP55DRAFT_434897 [Colletotrichum godetiae]